MAADIGDDGIDSTSHTKANRTQFIVCRVSNDPNLYYSCKFRKYITIPTVYRQVVSQFVGGIVIQKAFEHHQIHGGTVQAREESRWAAAGCLVNSPSSDINLKGTAD
jgi:hypothetical protein